MSLATTRIIAARGTTLGPRAQLALAAAIIAAILLVVFVAPMPLWHGEPTRPPAADAPSAPMQPLGAVGVLVAGGFALALLLPYRPYALAQQAARRWQGGAWPIVTLTAIPALAALFMFPRFGTDVFEYAAYARLWRVYGENPLLARPEQHPADALVALAWHPERPNAYGPLWQLLAWVASAAGGDSVIGQAVAFKALALVGFLACCALIWLAAPRAGRASALVTFAWSPLVLFDVLGKGHNDSLPAVLLLAAVVLAGRGRGGGIVVTALASLIKISAAGGALVILKHHLAAGERRAAMVSLALAALLGVAGYSLFWAGPAMLAPLASQVSQVVWSPGTLLLLAGERITGTPQPLAARLILGAAWAAGLGWVLWRLPARSTAELARATALVTLLTALLLTTAFYAHYLVPIIALAAVSESGRLRALVTALSVGALAAYAVEPLGLAFGDGWIGSDLELALGSLVTLGPALLLLAWWAARRAAPRPLGEVPA